MQARVPSGEKILGILLNPGWYPSDSVVGRTSRRVAGGELKLGNCRRILNPSHHVCATSRINPRIMILIVQNVQGLWLLTFINKSCNLNDCLSNNHLTGGTALTIGAEPRHCQSTLNRRATLEPLKGATAPHLTT